MPFGDFGDDGRLGVVAFLLLVGAFDDVGDVGGRLGVAGGGVGDDVGDLHGLVDQRVVDGAVGGDELLVVGAVELDGVAVGHSGQSQRVGVGLDGQVVGFEVGDHAVERGARLGLIVRIRLPFGDAHVVVFGAFDREVRQLERAGVDGLIELDDDVSDITGPGGRHRVAGLERVLGAFGVGVGQVEALDIGRLRIHVTLEEIDADVLDRGEPREFRLQPDVARGLVAAGPTVVAAGAVLVDRLVGGERRRLVAGGGHGGAEHVVRVGRVEHGLLGCGVHGNLVDAHVDPVHGAAVGGQYGHFHGGRLLRLGKQDDLLLLGAGVLLIHLGIGVALLQLDFKTGDVLIGIFAIEIDVDLLDGLGAAQADLDPFVCGLVLRGAPACAEIAVHGLLGRSRRHFI